MKVVLNISDKWSNTAEVSLLGYVQDFKKYQYGLISAKNIESWAAKLKELNGFFSLVKQDDNQVFAAVDYIRSRPLFYALNEECFYLSDNAEWVRQQVNDTVMDEHAKAEFQLTGYVTGKDTLYKNVKQLQAGECLLYSADKLTVERYYTFEHSEPSGYNEAALKIDLDVAAKASIQRLIKYANGRQIVIPLSGGYDSRLIVALLKEAGYTNVFAFTYGIKGNKEAAHSKVVADALGLEWHFIEYTEKLWKEAWQTGERKRYQLEGSGLSSLAHLQDWLAVKIMKEEGMVDSNAVFAPGHSGDMVAGSHIPSFIHEDLTTKYTKNELVEHLFSNHYCLTKHINVEPPISFFKEKIECSLTLQTEYTAQSFANECEKHNWQNRQSKFIFNSVRVYEFFDFDWWIPLWDKEFVQFFERTPLLLRNHEWYIKYVQKKYLEQIENTAEANVGNPSSLNFAKKIFQLEVIRKIGIKPFLKKIYRLVIKPKSILLLDTVNREDDVIDLTKKGYCSNGQIAYFFLKDLSK